MSDPVSDAVSGSGLPADLDLLDADFYGPGVHDRLAWLREHQPVAWDPVNELWGVFRYDDIVEVEGRDDVFVNSDRRKGGYRPNIPADPAIIGLDNPLHAQRRKLVSRRFTPRAVAQRESHVRAIVTELLDAALDRGRIDVVADLASVLPARMIGWLLGFPDQAWPQLRDWSERTMSLGGGPRYFTDDGFAATTEFVEAALALYADKQRCPADDVMSIWATAEIDRRPLTTHDVIGDCLLLLDGGAETTRTVIARGMLALIEQPAEWAALRSGADPAVATEELIRFVSPVHNMCRVARRDYDLGGVTIAAGQQVVLFYGAANRDPRHFVDPDRLDVRRTPNPHIGFGLGTHFCLGAGLARLEIRVCIEELVRRVAAMRLVSGPVETPNPFVYGIQSAVVELAAA